MLISESNGSQLLTIKAAHDDHELRPNIISDIADFVKSLDVTIGHYEDAIRELEEQVDRLREDVEVRDEDIEKLKAEVFELESALENERDNAGGEEQATP